ncbi:MAG TPA: hypothetical protein VNN62_23920 [Methylomirabilota bacterium]|nr:hypothetical protein [Methylomirabilota bacterium]
MRWHTQPQVAVVGTHVAGQNLDVVASTDLADQVPDLHGDVPRKTGLRYLVVKTQWECNS